MLRGRYLYRGAGGEGGARALAPPHPLSLYLPFPQIHLSWGGRVQRAAPDGSGASLPLDASKRIPTMLRAHGALRGPQPRSRGAAAWRVAASGEGFVFLGAGPSLRFRKPCHFASGSEGWEGSRESKTGGAWWNRYVHFWGESPEFNIGGRQEVVGARFPPG